MRWLLCLYPPAWRRRYADEFSALLDAQSPTPRVVLDVLAGALDAWLRPQVGQAAAPAVAGRARRRSDRFDKFTPRSRSALKSVAEEAELLHHDAIGPEHLLLGLMRSGDGLTAEVLRELTPNDVDEARRRLVRLLNRRRQPPG